jgi:hypothetical protein
MTVTTATAEIRVYQEHDLEKAKVERRAEDILPDEDEVRFPNEHVVLSLHSDNREDPHPTSYREDPNIESTYQMFDQFVDSITSRCICTAPVTAEMLDEMNMEIKDESIYEEPSFETVLATDGAKESYELILVAPKGKKEHRLFFSDSEKKKTYDAIKTFMQQRKDVELKPIIEEEGMGLASSDELQVSASIAEIDKAEQIESHPSLVNDETWDAFMDTVAFPEKHLPTPITYELYKALMDAIYAPENLPESPESVLTPEQWSDLMETVIFPQKHLPTPLTYDLWRAFNDLLYSPENLPTLEPLFTYEQWSEFMDSISNYLWDYGHTSSSSPQTDD